MALLKELKGSFVGGQVSPELQNRIDLEKFNTFVKEAKNTQIKPEGGISNRAGTVFIGVAKGTTFRLTINVNVSATIIINGIEYAGVTTKSVDLPINSPYTYSVGAVGYEGKSDGDTITQNTTIDVTLEESVVTYTFKIINEQSATISISVNGATPTTGTGELSVTANSGSTIYWKVEKTGYAKQENTFILTESNIDNPLDIELDEIVNGTVTITATPSYATIKINGVVQNSITDEIGTTFTYEVSATGYVTDSGTIEITQVSETKTINLQVTFLELSEIKSVYGESIANVLSTTIKKTGTYRITLKGGRQTNSSNFANGGVAIVTRQLSVGDVLVVRRINGAYYSDWSPMGTIYACAGCGIALSVNNVFDLVVGGGAMYKTVSYQSGNKYIGFGGGGYVGGAGLYNVDNVYERNGFSLDGTRGNSETPDTVAGGGSGNIIIGTNHKISYGGTSYISSDYTIVETHYASNEGDGYFKLEFLQ